MVVFTGSEIAALSKDDVTEEGNDLDYVWVTFAVHGLTLSSLSRMGIFADTHGMLLVPDSVFWSLCAPDAVCAPLSGLWLFVQPIASVSGWLIIFCCSTPVWL